MFTGIVEAVGTIRSATHCAGDLRLCIHSAQLDISDVQIGDSIATNGVCLTVAELLDNGYISDVSIETLEKSTLGELNAGVVVNLEKALTPASRLGGHLVSGHVDGVGKVISIEPSARSSRYWINAPMSLARYIAQKGSITVDGISLTVNEVDKNCFSLNIVPHTKTVTTVSHWRIDSKVNLEVDQVARYLERLYDPELKPSTAPEPVISTSFLAKHGFIR
ncbi:MAG: riboflavin synthase [Endozoicomonas sp. (ex Botrylloides leachii)]|nr:riboflavin synthase [Endozoicomonas sp. (ex Botrylloides leachii)]